MVRMSTGAVNSLGLVAAVWLIIFIVSAGFAFGAVGDFAINLSQPPNAPTGSTISVPTGSTVKASIAVSTGTSVLGQYDIILKFNQAVLKYLTSTNLVKNPANPQSAVGSLSASEVTAGQLRLAWYQGDYMSTDNVLKGVISLVEVTFAVLGTPGNSTDLTVTINNLLDPDAGKIGTTQQLIGPVTVSVLMGDTTAPTVTTFSIPATSSTLSVSIDTLLATDNVGVMGYMVTESPNAPAASDPGWLASPPTSYSFATAGTKTLYAWARDAAGNVSAGSSASVSVVVGDTTAPIVTAFDIPATTNILTVPVTIFTATDNVAVTGYMVTESATAPGSANAGWSVTAPASYTFTSDGTKTLYAWAKDAAGNISAGMTASIIVSSSSSGMDFTITRGLYDPNTGFMTLYWTSVAGQTYDLQYSDDPYSDNMNWTLLQRAIAAGTGEFTIYVDDGTQTGKAPGDPALIQRYYRVIINGSAPATYSKDWWGVFSTQLSEGMNLVSYPLIPESALINSSIGNQLRGASSPSDADFIWYWDTMNNQYDYAWLSTRPGFLGWRSVNSGGPVSDLSLDSGKGFWVQIRAGHGSKNLKLSGRVPTDNQTLNVVTGLQMFGSPYPVEVSLNDANIPVHGTSSPSSADRIWYWDRANKNYTYSWLSTSAAAPGWRSTGSGWPPANFTLKPGYGYWLQVRDQYQGFTWTYPKPYLR